MIVLNEIYKNSTRAESFIRSCENSFKRTVEKVSESILNYGDIRIVTLCGPTCSGKTTTASILTAYMEQRGKKARVLSIDDFYFGNDEMQKRGITDFEGPDAIDLPFLEETLEKLSRNEKVLLPTFDFTVRDRVSLTEYTPDKNDIYILEGIQAMYPEVRAMLGEIGYKSIYISVSKTLNVCGTRFTKEEIRFLRRVVRDHYHRGTTPEETVQMWPNVRRNEEKNIYPHMNKADYQINSLMPYEVLLLGKFFMFITENYPKTSRGYSVISDMRDKLRTLADNCITTDMIPAESVFREFIV